MSETQYIEFRGVKYFKTNSGYYLSTCNTNRGRKLAKGLHVAIWEFRSGTKVPKGWHVHHKDKNKENNEFENLECINPKEHSKHHRGPHMRISEKTREAAIAWHKSPKGRSFHVKISKLSWKKKTKKKATCSHCSSNFDCYFPTRSMYCSTRCRQRYYHARGMTTRQRARKEKLAGA